MQAVGPLALMGVAVVAQVGGTAVDGSWASLLETIGTIGSLLLFLYGFHVEWWVPGQTHKRKVKEADSYRAALDEHRDRLETKNLPLLVRAADSLSRVVVVLDQQEAAMREFASSPEAEGEE